MDGPADSRVFVVCGRAIQSELLQSVFSSAGKVEHVKIVTDKGVAYVKYDRASSAALAIENLNGAVLNQGRGPKLKVLLADSPSSRNVMVAPKPQSPELELSSDPDNMPLRSRLFIVVPKQADPQQIQNDMAFFPDLEYCKTDLIGSKGVVFCKFSRASSALRVLEEVAARGGQVAGYKVKCMLAEPKTKRGRAGDGSSPSPAAYGNMQQQQQQQNGGPGDYSYGMQMEGMYAHKMTPGGSIHRMHPMGDPYTMLGSPAMYMGHNQQQQQQQMHSPGSAGHLAGMDSHSQSHLSMSAGPHSSAYSTISMSGSMSQSPQHAVSRQRLFVVVHKAVPEEMVARLFRRIPGMEYCDLKKDRATGKSKGYAYVNYSNPDAANAAVEQLNGLEFPHQSSHRLKVMFAEPLGARPPPPHSVGSPLSHTPTTIMQVSTPSPHCGSGVQSAANSLAADLAAVTDSIASMSLPLSGSAGAMDLLAGAHLVSPTAADVARELMFHQ